MRKRSLEDILKKSGGLFSRDDIEKGCHSWNPVGFINDNEMSRNETC